MATRIIQRVCSLLDDAYFWSDKRDKGPSEFTEQFEAWVDPMPTCLEGQAVRIRHKYWDQERVEGFLEIMLVLARLHRWEVEDRRRLGENPVELEAEEFAAAVRGLGVPIVGKDADFDSAAAYYMERAAAEKACPWRLLVVDVLRLRDNPERREGFGPEIPGTDQVAPGIYVARNVESINTGKVIPLRRKP